MLFILLLARAPGMFVTLDSTFAEYPALLYDTLYHTVPFLGFSWVEVDRTVQQ